MKKYVHKVNYYETDKMGVTHHSNYVRFMEEARVDYLEQIGWGYDKMEANGIVSPVVSISCDYKKTTTFADVIEVEVAVQKCTAVKLCLEYTMTCNGDVVFTATSSHCFVDSNGRPLILERSFPDFYKVCKDLEKK